MRNVISLNGLAEEVILFYSDKKSNNKKLVFKKGQLDKSVNDIKINDRELVCINILQYDICSYPRTDEFNDTFIRDKDHCIVEIPTKFKPRQENGITILMHGSLLEDNPEFKSIVDKSGLVAGWNLNGFLFAATNEYKFIIDEIYEMIKSNKAMLCFFNEGRCDIMEFIKVNKHDETNNY